MNDKPVGGCACGAIRYACSDDPIIGLICHCRDCQRASGGAFSAVFFVATDRIRFEGTNQRFHVVTTDSGNRLGRGFCPTCGSPVSARWEGNPLYASLTAVHAGSLDDPSLFSPAFADWVSRAHPWHPFHPDIPKFAEKPTPDAFRDRVQAYFAARETSR